MHLKTGFERIINSPTITTWLNLISKSSALLLLSPLVFKFLSEQDVTNWFLIVTIVSFILIFDFGLLPNTTRILSVSLGEHEKHNDEYSLNTIITVIKQSKKLYFIISIVVFLVSVLIGLFFLSNRLMSLTTVHKGLLVVYICFSSCIAIKNNYFISIIQSFLQVHKVQRTLAIINVIVVLISSIALYLTKSLSITVILFFSNHIVAFFILNLLSRNILNSRNISTNGTTQKNLNIFNSEVFSSSWKSGVGVLFSMGLVYFSGFLVTGYYDNTSSAMYLFYLQIIRANSSFSQAPFYSAIPNYNYLYGSAKFKDFRKLIKQRFNYSLLLFVSLSIIFSFGIPEVLNVFKVDKAFSVNALWIWFVLSFYAERISAMLVQTYTISKKIIWHWLNGLNAMLIIALIFLMGFEDLNTLPKAMFLSYVFFNIPLIYFILKKKMKIDFKKEITLHVFIIFLIYFLVYYETNSTI